MRLLLDEMISGQVAERLSARGIDAAALVADAALRGLEDPDVFAEAQRRQRALVTFSVADFVAIVGQWAQVERSHNGVILVSSTTIPPSDLAGLSRALERFAANFKPWPAFSHWLSPQR